MTCSLCGRPIEADDQRQAWKQVVGWVRPKGADSMVGRRDTGAVAHASCIVALRHGATLAQDQLWNE